MLLRANHVLELRHILDDIVRLHKRYALGIVVTVLAQHLHLLPVAFVQFYAQHAQHLFARVLADLREKVLVQVRQRH